MVLAHQSVAAMQALCISDMGLGTEYGVVLCFQRQLGMVTLAMPKYLLGTRAIQ